MFVKKIINILLSLLFLLSCGQKKTLTNFTDVYIYVSQEDKYLVKDIIENYLFNFTFHTPEPQKRYNPIWRNATDFLDKPNKISHPNSLNL